ncbi:SUKH-4 family immunity protein [Streptomyces sp. SID8352]|uniref:SUKH-4 family immunity protein n=1 Tax=Streptomyces sp. SID8352 TaxID=2690338 RepID=UPI00136B7BA7|nr:SUKH-4 family immunity protein [Streptomyces sp. SID8352]MYU24917.1 hypothetical protein [Streptomyces sp. SID8352]
MVTFAQAQERAEEWVNGDVPAYQHREVRVREFGLGFVVWAEDRPEGPRSDGGLQRLVIARDSGEATLWPALPVGEVIRRYEEEYGRAEEAGEPAPAPAARMDLNQTSFLLSPPEWLQEAADRLGIPDRRGGDRDARDDGTGDHSTGDHGTGDHGAGERTGGAPGGDAPVGGADPGLAETLAGVPMDGTPAPGTPAPGAPEGGSAWPSAAPAADGGADTGGAGAPAVPAGATPWTGTDTTAADAGEDRSVPLPETVFSPPLSVLGPEDTPPPGSEARTTLMSGGSGLPATALAPALDDPAAPGAPGTPGARDAATGAVGGGAAPSVPAAPGAPPPGPVPGSATPPPGAPAVPGTPPPGAGQDPAARHPAPNAGDIADAATSRAAPPPRRPSGVPHPPGAPGVPGARPDGTPPPAPGATAGGYAPTQLVSSLGPGGPGTPPQGTPPPAAPGTPPPPGATPPGGAHHAATMLADPGRPGGVPAPPGRPAAPGASAGGAGGAVHHAETMLAAPPVSGPAVPPPPPAPGVPAGAVPPGAPQPAPPGYGYPQPPPGRPIVGPGYQAVLRYRAQDGSEQQLIRRSAPGTPHPEWQIFHELRAMNVPPDQVLELHTELESCELPGAYCARMIREQWPQARITSIAPYGTDHASRQQGMAQLLAHQGELHQVADGPARPAPVRAPLPPVQPAPPVPPEGIGQELAGAFGPGVFRFEQAAVSRQGVPPVVAHTLVAAGLPMDMGPFFWAQAQPGRPVPTLAELAAERGVRPAPDAGSYLVVGSDFGRAVCVQYGTANIVAVPVEAGPGGAPVPPQFVNTGLPEFARCLALLGRMWRLRFGLNQEQAGRWTVDFQAQLASLDPAALGSPESWWSVLLEQMWDGLL